MLGNSWCLKSKIRVLNLEPEVALGTSNWFLIVMYTYNILLYLQNIYKPLFLGCTQIAFSRLLPLGTNTTSD